MRRGSRYRSGSSADLQSGAVLFSKGSRPDECEKVLSLHAAGDLKVAIGHVFPLENVADAHRGFEGRQQFGRVLLDIGGLGLRPNV